MKVKFEKNRLVFLGENTIEEAFISELITTMTDSKKFTGWAGDVDFDGQEATGYIVTREVKK